MVEERLALRQDYLSGARTARHLPTTLEVFDEKQAETIDQIEVGRRISGQVRFALQVPDLDAAMDRLLAHGATLVHSPVVTPWGDRNVRFQDPDGMQITLYQAADGS